jgi:patatin-related protein
MGAVARNLDADAYHIDGGVLDNRPISLALDAIAERPADKHVNRLLFFIDPDPEQILPRTAQLQARAYSAPEVILKAMVSLPGYQSLTNALQAIAQRNQAVKGQKRTLDYFNEASMLFRAREDGTVKAIKAEDQGQGRKAHGARKFIAAVDRSSGFYRATEDGYLDLRLKRVSDSLFQLFSDLNRELPTQLDVEATQARSPENKRKKNAWFLHNALYCLKTEILQGLDLKYYQRKYHYLAQVVRDLQPKLERTGTGDGIGDSHKAYMLTTMTSNRMKDYFYDQEGTLRAQENLEKDAQDTEINQLRLQLQGALEKVREKNRVLKDQLAMATPEAGGSGTAGKPQPQANALRLQQDRAEWEARQDMTAEFAQPLELLLAQIEQSSFLSNRRQFLSALKQNSKLMLENEVSNLVRDCEPLRSSWKQGQDQKRDLLSAPEESYWMLVDAVDSFFLRDMMIYPVMDGDKVATEFQPVRLVRISPQDAVSYKDVGARDKLAGKALAHFGGFLNERWRGSDLTWGRLDAADIILHALVPEQFKNGNPDGPAMLEKVQDEIIREMNDRGMRVYFPNDGQFEHLIGRQTLADIPTQDKIRWSLRGALTSVKILRKSVADSGAAFWLRWLTNGLDWIVNGLTWAVVLVTLILKRNVFRWALGIAFLVVVVMLLWENSLHAWWDLLLQKL